VQSEFGWHVIKLEAVADESTRGYEEVRAELEIELRRSEVEKAFGDAQEELDTLSFEASGDLAKVATQVGKPIKRIPRFTRGGSAELGATPAVTEAVFSPDVLAGRELRTIELAPGRMVALGVSAHEARRARPLEEIRVQITNAARLAAAQKLAVARAKSVAEELAAGGAWATVTRAWQKPAPADTHMPRVVRRDDMQVPAEIKTAAFRAPQPAVKPSYGTAVLGTGDVAIWSVTAVRAGVLAALSPSEQQREREQARERAAMSDSTAYVIAMRENADIDVNPQLFE